jgi:hypothetical protein
MKIKRLIAENFKRIVAVDITPDGRVIELSGKNAQGKSSTLDAIESGLLGGTHLPGVPLRRGTKKGRIEITLGGDKVELIVERTFDADGGSKITVSTGTGARKSSPQTILNGLLGKISFDPLEFTRMKPAEQFDTVRALVDIDVDFEELDGLNTRDINLRTEAGRNARALQAQAEGIIVPPDCPTERRDTTEILDRLTSASEHNAAVEREVLRRADRAKEASQHRAAAERCDTEAAELRRRAAELDKDAAAFRLGADQIMTELANLPPPPELIDATAVRAELSSAEDTNELVARKARRDDLLTKAAASEAEVKRLSDAIEARRTAKIDAIRATKMPIEGLGFGDKEVTYNGLPLDQASDAERLRISVAIAMAANPTLRVIRIREGSLLDNDGFALIAKMAEEHDYQVWIEAIQAHGGPSIIIEDGHALGTAAAEPESGTLL